MLGVELGAADYIERLKVELGRVNLEEVQQFSDLLFDAWQHGRFVFLVGNGGSACTCSHFAEDLGKNCVRPEDVANGGRRLKILSLTDNVGWITALGNDYAYDQIFVQQLMHYATPGDLLIAISGSGNSPNILAAVDWANRHGLTTFGMTGYDGGKLKKAQKCGIHVPLCDMGMVESIHLCIGHWVVDDLMARIAGTGRRGMKDGR
ncbi:MAG: SIS domain-containing protein [Thermoguttaceae bacterium]|nr:SIS domain-containing protein [Thermoguttaceae bacterium]